MKGIIISISLMALLVMPLFIFAQVQVAAPKLSVKIYPFEIDFSAEDENDRSDEEMEELQDRVDALLRGMVVFYNMEIVPVDHGDATFAIAGTLARNINEFTINFTINDKPMEEELIAVGTDELAAHLTRVVQQLSPASDGQIDPRFHEIRRMSLVSRIEQEIDTAEMVEIPGGTFTMGSPHGNDDERPLHEVEVDTFYMDKYEVTNDEYVVFLNQLGTTPNEANRWLIVDNYSLIYYYDGPDYAGADEEDKEIGWYAHEGYDTYPIFNISYYGALAYCQDQGKRLPTESEWEYAARGTGEHRYDEYFWGDEWDPTRTNNLEYSGQNKMLRIGIGYWNPNYSSPIAVGQFDPNSYGLHDMLGNVWEWTKDYYSLYPDPNYERNRSNAEYVYDRSRRVLRGGSFASLDMNNRTACRLPSNPNMKNVLRGFRCASSQLIE